jgi:hypothetical protein
MENTLMRCGQFARLAGLSVAICCMAGCVQEPSRFQEGKESPHLAQQLTGEAAIGQGLDTAAPDQPRIVTVSFPTVEKKLVASSAMVDAITGPSRGGIIAYIESGWDGNKGAFWKSLKTCDVRLGKALATCFTVYGAECDKYGRHIAISPDGRYVAFLLLTGEDQMPGALLTSGTIMLWDLKREQSTTTSITALNDFLSWFPNSEELLFTALSDRGNMNALPRSPLTLQAQEAWSRYPVSFVYHVMTKKVRSLHPGIHTLLSPDGQTILLLNGGLWTLVDTGSLASKQLGVPSGYWLAPRALLNDRKCLYVGFPTEGSVVRRSKYGSFSVGSLMKSLKVGDLDTWEFQTIIPYFDYRDPVSFGETSAGKKGGRE